MFPKVYISGMYSGPSPSAGLGIARSVKSAFPELNLIGVDHWNGSSGLHHECLSDRLVFPAWSEINKEVYRKTVQGFLDEGHLWISSHDIEVDFLSKELSPHPRLLVPKPESFRLTTKPGIQVKELLPFAVPEQMALTENDETVYAFCRRHSWRIWMKGPYHEAFAVTNWKELEHARQTMMRQWPAHTLFIQAHVRGYEESICFSSYEGRLLDVIKMEKRVTTAEGKTWAGRILDLNEDLVEVISKTVKTIGWTGGAEIELIRDFDDRLWLMEWNPRFPAWIYGAALAGRNLPAQLLAAATGLVPQKVKNPSPEFTRVVLEIPVDQDHWLPLPKEPLGLVNAGKYGAGLTTLAKSLLKKEDNAPALSPATLPLEIEKSLEAELPAITVSPQRVFLSEVAEKGFATIKRLLAEASTPSLRLVPAYSFKTSPDDSYIALAQKNGLLAECISQLEVQRALKSGYPADKIVVNGPGKWWPQELTCPKGLKALFCDSVEELERVVAMPGLAATIGIRVQLPSIKSRFGIPLEDFQTFQAVCEQLRKLPAEQKIGVHYHMASSAIGVTRWFDAFESVLSWAATLGEAVGKPLTTLDLGGGWLKADFEQINFRALAHRVAQTLPQVREIFFEPGKALTQETMALRTRVLEVRKSAGKITEAVVDGCIAELPLAAYYPHRTLWRDGSGKLIPLAGGKHSLLGRICMEDDVMAKSVALPDDLQIGDDIIFLEAGAYERTMSYEFGRG